MMIPPSLLTHIGTNYAPSDDERSTILKILEGPDSEVAAIDEEIYALKLKSDILMARRSILTKKTGGLRALVSPIRRIPCEVLIEIFLFCLPTAHNSTIDPLTAPVILTHICAAWRALAFDTPALWASIHIPAQFPLNFVLGESTLSNIDKAYISDLVNTSGKQVKVITAWIARSGRSPLSISFHHVDLHDLFYPLDNCRSALLHTFLPLSQRWKSVSLSTTTSLLKRIAALTEDDVPYLEEIFLHDPTMTIDHTLSFKDSTFLHAPSLRRVSLINIPGKITEFPLRWSQLTHLSLDGVPRQRTVPLSVRQTWRILDQSPMLQEARFQICHSWKLNGNTCPGPVFCHHLTVLGLHEINANISSLLENVAITGLIRLEYHTMLEDRIGVGNQRTQPVHVYEFIRRSSGTLRSLETNLVYFDRRILSSKSERLPKLVELQLTLYSRGNSSLPSVEDQKRLLWFDDELLGRLVGQGLVPEASGEKSDDGLGNLPFIDFGDASDEDDGSAIFPHLEVLQCQFPVAVTDSALLDFIQLRQARIQSATTARKTTHDRHGCEECDITPLRVLSLYIDRPQTLPLRQVLQPYVEAGLILDLVYLNLTPAHRYAIAPADGIPDEASYYKLPNAHVRNRAPLF